MISQPSSPTTGEPSAPLVPSAETTLDLTQRVRLFLMASNEPGMRHVGVDVDGDTVYLRGRVGTFYEKQLALRLSKRVAGVLNVVDLLEVRGYLPRSESEGSRENPRSFPRAR